MSNTSILLVLISILFSVNSDYVRQKDNVLNKGVWVKADSEKLFDKSGFGDFVFKPNSINIDDLLQDDFYSFDGNHVQDSPFIPNYVERAKRSPKLYENGFRKGVKGCNEKDCDTNNKVNNNPVTKLDFTRNRNDPILTVYPYDVAVLLGNVKNNNKIMVEEIIGKSVESKNIDHKDSISNDTNQRNKTFEVIMANEILVDNTNDNFNISMLPKRSMNKNYESEIIKKIEIVEGVNESKKSDRTVFDDKIKSWQYNAPIPDVNVYKVIPKNEEHTAISERGLLKLLSILTKTFKKIMKQHTEIKKIHSEMFAGKEDIDKSVSLLINKFNDFEAKYSDLKNHNEKIQGLYKKIEDREEYFKTKENEMAHNLADFENQQKKFLTQQRQFYNIQKLMLSQNEKINTKQNLIAKTQSEISRRQNNFARILKKAKQLYLDKKQTNPKSQSKITNSSETNSQIVITTTDKPFTTESVKIDLFSIPSTDSLRLENQDKLILKEKDEHPVDDLVYKYYFNNTFIDNLMKNQILSGYLHGNKYMTRNAKSKRNESKKIKSTILIPVDNNALDSKAEPKANENRRPKRWIRHHSKGRQRRRHHKMTTAYEMKDDKQSHPNNNLINDPEKSVTTAVNYIIPEIAQANIIKSDKLAISIEKQLNPFTVMSANFCNQIGQNGNPIMMSWCIEKVLRRLQNIETIPVVATLQQAEAPSSTKTTTTASSSTQSPTSPSYTSSISSVSETTPPPASSQMATQSTTELPKSTAAPTLLPTPVNYFPDNDELESNLKEYELKPDEEGNVYFEGSVHASEMFGADDSDGLSDILPGADSNSRIQMDPLTMDLHSRRMNGKIKTQRGIV